jgi:hypothetical protein
VLRDRLSRACDGESSHVRCGLGERVIDQARRRVLNGEQVPTPEKIYSIFEPHTDLIKRGEVRTPVEFDHKVFLAESAKGLIRETLRMKFMWRRRSNATAAPSAVPRNSMARIAASSASRTYRRACKAPSRRSVFPSAAATTIGINQHCLPFGKNKLSSKTR